MSESNEQRPGDLHVDEVLRSQLDAYLRTQSALFVEYNQVLGFIQTNGMDGFDQAVADYQEDRAKLFVAFANDYQNRNLNHLDQLDFKISFENESGQRMSIPKKILGIIRQGCH